MKKTILFGSGTANSALTVTAQRRLNCFFEPRQDGDKNTYAIYGTPGKTLFSTVGQTAIRGTPLVFGASMFVVQGSTLWEVDTTGATFNRGTIPSNGFVSMAANLTQIIIVDGSAGYVYTPSTTTLTTISDGNFPNGATTVCFQDGFFIANKYNSQQFYVSQSYDGTNWTPAAFASAESNPDNLLAVDSDHGMLILWGVSSIEFWQNIGALDFQFAPLRGSTQQYGLAAVWSRARFMDSIAFLGQNLQGQYQVFVTSGAGISRISDSDIDSIINDFAVVSDAVALSYEVRGHPMYQLNFPTANRSFLYDGLTSMWSGLQYGVGLQGRDLGQFGVFFNTDHYVTDYNNGNIYRLDNSVYTDNGTNIKRMLQTRHMENQGNLFGVDEVFLDMETGVGLQSGQGSDPQMMLQISRDGGRTFGSERWTSIGKVGQYIGPRVTWRRLGQSRDMVLRFTMTDPVKFAMTYQGMNIRPGRG